MLTLAWEYRINNGLLNMSSRHYVSYVEYKADRAMLELAGYSLVLM